MPGIGRRIREKREALGMTQEELAQKLGYRNKSTIAKIETGTNDIVQSKVIEFADALNTTAAYLMGWDNETPQKKKDAEGDFENQKTTNADYKLQKIIGYYNEMDDIGKNELVDQAEYIKNKHPKIKAEDKVM